KNDEERVKTVLFVASQIVANLAILAQPFLPKTADKLFEMLNFGYQGGDRAGEAGLLCTCYQLGAVKFLFEKITDEQVDLQLQKLADAKVKNAAVSKPATPAKANITFDDFMKLDIRIGTIVEATKVPKTKKLLKLPIDTGIDQRTV